MSDTAPEPGSTGQTEPAVTWTARHPMVTYTLARVVLFAVPFVILYFVADFFTALLVAFLLSAVASIFLLRKQREALSASIASRAERANARMAERAAAEDSWDDSQRAADASGRDVD